MELSVVYALAPYGAWGAGAQGFLSALSDNDCAVREAAAEVVGRCAFYKCLPRQSAITALSRAAERDSDARVRIAARAALATLAN